MTLASKRVEPKWMKVNLVCNKPAHGKNTRPRKFIQMNLIHSHMKLT